MKKEKTFCPHCGATTIEHREVLNRGLVRGLITLAEDGEGSANLRSLGFTRSQWQNFSKLRYWDFVQKIGEQEKGGSWAITESGRAFLRGSSVPKVLWTYRGKRIRYEDDRRVTVESMLPDYRYRADYSEDSRPHGEEGLLF